ncbi:AMP-binding protein [Sulfidibacter corallicola]|uniref:AMP-binding protein n=1 Tax=Sulfidibacter corallicola TaxID=2818388 RepID=A0A8A4TGQ2_SULCO|nr:AMP-binding protein [Sulfidibacter corallicola]QTD47898.1 AMP-binding protein [Sulfidibacter corallicola]
MLSSSMSQRILKFFPILSSPFSFRSKQRGQAPTQTEAPTATTLFPDPAFEADAGSLAFQSTVEPVTKTQATERAATLLDFWFAIDFFEEQTRMTPHQIAVEFKSQAITYTGLNQRANALAHRMKSLGIGGQSRIGIALKPGIHWAAALLAGFKTGATVMVMPAEACTATFDRLPVSERPSLIVTEKSIIPELTARGAEAVSAVRASNETPYHRRCAPSREVHKLQTACWFSHDENQVTRNDNSSSQIDLACYLARRLRTAPTQPGTVTLQWASVHTEIAVLELFSTLSGGGTLRIADRES